jgi:hypothetical protein
MKLLILLRLKFKLKSKMKLKLKFNLKFTEFALSFFAGVSHREEHDAPTPAL